MAVFLLQCPKCKQRMKYKPFLKFFSSSRKRCVYCGCSFSVKDCIVEKLK